jgi:riboflavin-specific deaminase-like protein
VGIDLERPIRRLLPECEPTTIGSQLGELDLIAQAGDERPYVITNFALTLDGHATISGRSGAIGSDADTAMLVGLRTLVDAVMIGAGTMRAERYGPPVGDAAKRELREQRGLAAQPLMVIVSGSLDLPWDAPLFTAGSGSVLICTASDTEPPPTATEIHLLRQPGGCDLGGLLSHLRSERGVRTLLCEGGPRIHGELVEAGLVDELFVTQAPKLGGGVGPGLIAGLAEDRRDLELAWLLTEESTGELFGRYLTGAAG